MSGKYNFEVYRKPVTKYDEYGDFVVHRNNEYYKSPSYNYQTFSQTPAPQTYDSKKQSNYDYGGDLGKMQYDLTRFKKSNPIIKPQNIFSQNANNLLQDQVDQNQYNARYQSNSTNQQYDDFKSKKNQSAVYQTVSQSNTDRNNYQSQLYSSKEQFYQQQKKIMQSPQHGRLFNSFNINDKIGYQPDEILYNKQSYQVPTYKNKNIRSVAQSVIKNPYVPDKMDFGNRQNYKVRELGLDQPVLSSPQRIQQIQQNQYNDIFLQVNNRNKEQQQDKLEFIEKDIRRYATAYFNEVGYMKNLSQKLNNFKQKIQNISDPQKANRYRRAIERRIKSQMSNDRKIKITNMYKQQLENKEI